MEADGGATDDKGRPSQSRPRYDYEIDANSNNTHAKILRLVGSGKRVLELGCATGYMSRALKDRGCTVVGVEIDPVMGEIASTVCDRLIVGDIEQIDWMQELGDQRFDVVLAADVLEHLKDPNAVLHSVRAYLDTDGCLIASIPNIAHGSLRLALFQGRFEYSDLGLLDRTHVRFFTAGSLQDLFADTGFALAYLGRHDIPFDATEVKYDQAAAQALVGHLEEDPNARTYQFLAVAYPVPSHAALLLRERIDVLAAESGSVRTTLKETLSEAALDRAHLEAQLGATQKDFEAQLGAMVRDLRAGTTENRVLSEHLSALVDTREQLQAELADKTRRLDELEHECCFLRGERESLQRDLYALQRTRTVVMSQELSATAATLAGQARHPLQSAAALRKRLLPKTKNDAGLIRGEVESPVNGGRSGGDVWVEGWAASGRGKIRQVEVMLDDADVPQHELAIELQRSETPADKVDRALGPFRYSGAVSIVHKAPGEVTVRIKVTDAAGNSREFVRLVSFTPAAVEDNRAAEPQGLVVEARPVVSANGGNPLVVLATTKLQEFLAFDERLAFPAVATPVVSAVIPTHNGAHYTLMMLESLRRAADEVPLEVIVVDNASTDSTAELLGRLINVRVELNETNLGFGDACNAGARLARGKYVTFLNSDVVLTRGCIQSLVQTIEGYPSCGAVGVKLVHMDGTLQEAGSIIWGDGSALGYGRGGDPEAPEYCYLREVDYCSAACLMVRADLFRSLGGFDKRYAPAYYEDADLCLAVWEAGYKVVYQPHARALHVEYGSTDAKRAVALQLRNRAKFVAKWTEQLAGRLMPGRFQTLMGRDRRPGPRALVVDDRVPESGLGQGMPRAMALVNMLADLGYVVTFQPVVPSAAGKGMVQLQWRGVETLGAGASVAHNLSERAGLYQIAVVSRPHNAKWMRVIRRHNPAAAVVYDAEAVFAVREILRAAVEGRTVSTSTADGLVDEEVALAAGADAVLTVSEHERGLFQARQPDVPGFVWGTVAKGRQSTAGFADRRDLLFVGYLGSPPNDDAATHFVREVFPRLHAQLSCRLFLAGAEPSAELVACASPFGEAVVITGFVDDLAPLYDRCRVFIAPHRFAAGIPLKVVEAMAQGIPCVVSQVLAGQLAVVDGEEALVGDGEDELAAKIVALYGDREQWERLQANAYALVERRYSPEVLMSTLSDCIDRALASR